jgi:steroid delta-isomerase-like uncharacterized protein
MGQTKDVVDHMWEAVESHDFGTIAQLVAPDAEITQPGDIHLRGAEMLLPFLRAYLEAFPDLGHRVVDYVESGDTIALELRVTGTHTGTLRTPGGDIPPTGKRVIWESVDYIKVDGDTITSWHTYLDQAAFLAQLGLMPAPAVAQA